MIIWEAIKYIVTLYSYRIKGKNGYYELKCENRCNLSFEIHPTKCSSYLSFSHHCECQKTPRQILKGPCKLLVRSMCAMGHSHIRFIPSVVLIMSTFYLLCKARSTEACNKPTFPIINLQDGIGGFRLIANSPLYHLLFFSYYYSCLLTQFFSFFNPFFLLPFSCLYAAA